MVLSDRRVRLNRGKTALLLRMHVVKKPGVAVCFGSDRFKFGQGECEMMTFNEKRRWLFPLVPTCCAYAKLDAYFGKLRKAGVEARQMKGDFGKNLAVRNVAKTKNRRLMSKMEKSKAIISDMEDAIQNSLLRVADTISGCPGEKIDFENLKEI